MKQPKIEVNKTPAPAKEAPSSPSPLWAIGAIILVFAGGIAIAALSADKVSHICEASYSEVIHVDGKVALVVMDENLGPTGNTWAIVETASGTRMDTSDKFRGAHPGDHVEYDWQSTYRVKHGYRFSPKEEALHFRLTSRIQAKVTAVVPSAGRSVTWPEIAFTNYITTGILMASTNSTNLWFYK